MLVLSSLIFAASFWAALWLDGRMRLKTKGQSWLERVRRAFLQIGTDLPRELLKLWKALSVAWMMFAVWRMLSSCVAGPDGWSCPIGGNVWILETHHVRWGDVLRILALLCAFPVVGLIAGTVTLRVLDSFPYLDDSQPSGERREFPRSTVRDRNNGSCYPQRGRCNSIRRHTASEGS